MTPIIIRWLFLLYEYLYFVDKILHLPEHLNNYLLFKLNIRIIILLSYD